MTAAQGAEGPAVAFLCKGKVTKAEVRPPCFPICKELPLVVAYWKRGEEWRPVRTRRYPPLPPPIYSLCLRLFTLQAIDIVLFALLKTGAKRRKNGKIWPVLHYFQGNNAPNTSVFEDNAEVSDRVKFYQLINLGCSILSAFCAERVGEHVILLVAVFRPWPISASR
jgi:hypothetical protein